MRSRSSAKRTRAAAAGGAALLLLVGCGYQAAADPGAAPAPDPRPAPLTVKARLHDLNGVPVGTARLTDQDGQTHMVVSADGLAPGYHGMHVHTIGLCDGAGGFVSAGGHLAADNETHHGEHAGDLPSLYVGKNGHGLLRFVTDAFTPTGLLDADGSALILHAGRDNFANIPTRYAPGGPDIDTRKTGDSGARVVCGVVAD